MREMQQPFKHIGFFSSQGKEAEWKSNVKMRDRRKEKNKETNEGNHMPLYSNVGVGVVHG